MPVTQQPYNFGHQFQDVSGQIRGQALSQFGQDIGSAIQKVQKKREEEKKKLAAQNYFMNQFGMSEKDSKDTVNAFETTDEAIKSIQIFDYKRQQQEVAQKQAEAAKIDAFNRAINDQWKRDQEAAKTRYEMTQDAYERARNAKLDTQSQANTEADNAREDASLRLRQEEAARGPSDIQSFRQFMDEAGVAPGTDTYKTAALGNAQKGSAGTRFQFSDGMLQSIDIGGSRNTVGEQGKLQQYDRKLGEAIGFGRQVEPFLDKGYFGGKGLAEEVVVDKVLQEAFPNMKLRSGQRIQGRTLMRLFNEKAKPLLASEDRFSDKDNERMSKIVGNLDSLLESDARVTDAFRTTQLALEMKHALNWAYSSGAVDRNTGVIYMTPKDIGKLNAPIEIKRLLTGFLHPEVLREFNIQD